MVSNIFYLHLSVGRCDSDNTDKESYVYIIFHEVLLNEKKPELEKNKLLVYLTRGMEYPPFVSWSIPLRGYQDPTTVGFLGIFFG